MATVTRPLQSVPREQIAEHADSVRPSEIAATVITAFFFAIGWVFGATWRGIVYCCLAIRYGYRTGAHVPVAAPQAEQPRGGGRPGPGGTLIEELLFPGARFTFRAEHWRVLSPWDPPAVQPHHFTRSMLLTTPAVFNLVLYSHN